MAAFSRFSGVVLVTAFFILPAHEDHSTAQQSTVRSLSNAVDPGASGSDFQNIHQRATAGDVNAQIALAKMYDEGKGVPQSCTEAFVWWLKAAEQGAGTAQHNVGVAYVSGVGVGRNELKALEWFTKAAEQGHVKAQEYANRIRRGHDAAPLVIGNRDLKAVLANTPVTSRARYGAKEEICRAVVTNFVATHKYAPGSFVCVEFAAGVWWELMRKGVNARVRIGSTDIASINSPNHAWVMAEMSPGIWIAIEPQKGIVYPEQGSLYYRGFDFAGDAEVRQHNRCLADLREARRIYNEEVEKRDEYQARYNNGDIGTKTAVLPALRMQQQYVGLRLQDVKREEARLSALLKKALPAE